MIHFIYGVGGELSTDTLDLQKDKLEGPRVNYAWNVTKDKNDKTEDVLLHDVLHHEKEGFFGKDNNAGKKQKAGGKEEDQIQDRSTP